MMIDDDAGEVVAPTDVVLSIDASSGSDRSIQSKAENNDGKMFDNEHNACVHHNSYVEGDDKDRVQARVDYTINESIMMPNSNINIINNKNNQANNKNIAYTNLPSHGNNTNEEGIDQVTLRNTIDIDSPTPQNTQSNSSIPTQSNANRWQWMERLGVTLLETVDRIGKLRLLHSIYVMIVIDEMIVYTCDDYVYM